jgi:hypothetical protein
MQLVDSTLGVQKGSSVDIPKFIYLKLWHRARFWLCVRLLSAFAAPPFYQAALRRATPLEQAALCRTLVPIGPAHFPLSILRINEANIAFWKI